MSSTPSLRDFTPVYHPAGFDHDLRGALSDIKVGHWHASRRLLAQTSSDWALRTSRTQVMAAAARHTAAVHAWLQEEPDSVNAQLMSARTAVEGALSAFRDADVASPRLEDQAWQKCQAAARRSPADPVPWVGLLALAQYGEHSRRPECWRQAPETMLPPGPWGLLEQVLKRDPTNREAFHRMLQFFLTCRYSSLADALDFARWAASWVPVGSPPRILPLYVRMESYRRHREAGTGDPMQHRQWARDPVIHEVRRAFQGWKGGPCGPRVSVLDLNYLAHALWAAHQYEDAAQVFHALGRNAARLPWAYVCDNPAEPSRATQEFVRARSQCLSPTRRRSVPSPGPRRSE
ncbi:hypothetical protein ACIQVR_37625 [Streptomyces xanthochromogenes]|uniref:hypothetical protein n=1 Tax=Streptomyces xanthochromogenes TaxID=67384 RepID=UPI003806ED9D